MRIACILALVGSLFARPTQASEPVRDPSDPSLACLTSAIYYEAAREPLDGQRAVARVVLNRLASPAYPKTVCAVIYQGSSRATGCQFTFTCDGALSRRADPGLWQQAAGIAADALTHPEALPMLGALHYHADYVRPYWAASMREEVRIGHHVFCARGRVPTAPKVIAGGKQATAATFSAWGLSIARVTPDVAGSMSISSSPTDPS